MLSFTDNFFTKAELGAGGLLMDMAFLVYPLMIKKSIKR
jgi:hypothetical protein